jgi:hypothetical protein
MTEDFSWRNRIAAWTGALQIAADNFRCGTGWDLPTKLYNHYYLSTKLTECAALETNDFLMLGATPGGPAVFCFWMYLWLTLKKDGEGFRLWALGFGTKKQKTENQGDNVESGPAEREGKRESEGGKAESVSSFILHPSSFLQATCHAGAIVLLVGFWFDGGLCELPTAATFWILLELGAVQPQENYLTASAAAKALVDRKNAENAKNDPEIPK